MRRITYLLGAMMLLVGVLAVAAYAGGEHPDNVTLCHASGLEGTTKYETLTVGYEAAFGPAGHFDENGTPNAGHEQDYLGECQPPPPVDVCPNLEGDQSEVPPGYHLGEDENGRPICIQNEGIPLATGASFTEATCDTSPSVQLVKTNIEGLGLRPFYNVEGPDFIDGHPAPGGTYTFTPISIVGFVLTGGTEFTHTFAATPTECGPPPPPPDVCPNIAGTQSTVPAGMVVAVNGDCVTPVPPEVSGTASVICLLPAGIYQLSGTVDGQAADSVNPATLPGSTKGVTNVVVTRGDTSVRTAVATNGDCGTTTTVTTTPTVSTESTTTPTTTTPPAVKPVVKPKPKPPVRKPAAKPKPKPKHKAPPKKKPQKAPHTLGL